MHFQGAGTVVVELDDSGELGGADGIWSKAGPAIGGRGGVDRSRTEGPAGRKWRGRRGWTAALEVAVRRGWR
jgi:hypothetical protein